MYNWLNQVGSFFGVTNTNSSSSRSREMSPDFFNNNDSSSSSPAITYSSSSPPPVFELFFLPNEPKIGILRINRQQLSLLSSAAVAEDNNNINKKDNSSFFSSSASVARILSQAVREATNYEEQKMLRTLNKNKKISIDCIMNCMSATVTEKESNLFLEVFGCPPISVPMTTTLSDSSSPSSSTTSLDSLKWLCFLCAMINQNLHASFANDNAINKSNRNSNNNTTNDGNYNNDASPLVEEDHRIILATCVESPFLSDSVIDYSLLVLTGYFLFEGRIGWAESSENAFEQVLKAANLDQQQRFSSSSLSRNSGRNNNKNIRSSSSNTLLSYPIRPSLRRSHCHLHLLNRFRLLFVMPSFPLLQSSLASSASSSSSSSLLNIESVRIQFSHNSLSSMMSMISFEDADEQGFSFSPTSFWLCIENNSVSSFHHNDTASSSSSSSSSIGQLYQLDTSLTSSSSTFSLVFKLQLGDEKQQPQERNKVILNSVLSGDCIVSLFYQYRNVSINDHKLPEKIRKKNSRLILRTIFSTFFATTPSLIIRPHECDTEPTEWPFPDQQFYISIAERMMRGSSAGGENNNNDNTDEASSPLPKRPPKNPFLVNNNDEEDSSSSSSSFSCPAAFQFLQATSISFELKKFEDLLVLISSSDEQKTSSPSSFVAHDEQVKLIEQHDKEEMNTLLDTARRSPLQKILSENNYQMTTKQAEQTAMASGSPLSKKKRIRRRQQFHGDGDRHSSMMYDDNDDDDTYSYYNDGEHDSEDDNTTSHRGRSISTASRAQEDFSITNDDFFFLGVPVFNAESLKEQQKRHQTTNRKEHREQTKKSKEAQNSALLRRRRASVVGDFVLARRQAEPQLAVALDEFAKINNLKKLSYRFTRKNLAENAIETEEDLLAMIRLEYDERQRSQEEEIFLGAEEHEEPVAKHQHVDPVVVSIAKKEETKATTTLASPKKAEEAPTIPIHQKQQTEAVQAAKPPPSNPMLAELLARTQSKSSQNTATTKPTGGMAGIFAELKAKAGTHQDDNNNKPESATSSSASQPTSTPSSSTTTASSGFRPPRKGPPPRPDGKMPPCPMRDYFPEGKEQAAGSINNNISNNGSISTGNPLAAAAAAIAAMKNKQQQQVKPVVVKPPPGPKLKTFFWKKLKLKQKVGIWAVEDEEDVGGTSEKAKEEKEASTSQLHKNHEEFLKSLFLNKPPEEKKKPSSSALQENESGQQQQSKKKKSTALSGQRSQHVGIVLKKLKLTPDLFCTKLLECSEDLVDGDVIDAVYRAMPLPDEIKNLKYESEKRDQIEWGDPEEALFAISQNVPDAKERLGLLKAINDVPNLLQTTENQLKNILDVVPMIVVTAGGEDSGEEEKKSKNVTDTNSNKNDASSTSAASSSSTTAQSLAKILRMILKVGNFLNKGTVHGNALGFSLETLSTLTMMKSIDAKSTLMDAMIEMFYFSSSSSMMSTTSRNDDNATIIRKAKKPELQEDFAEELLKSLNQASQIAMSQLALNAAELTRTMQRTRTKMMTAADVKNTNNNNNNTSAVVEDRLPLVAKEAYETFGSRVASLLINEQNVRDEIISVIDYFGDAQNLISGGGSSNSNSGTNNNNASHHSQQQATVDEVTLFTCLRSFCRDWIKSRRECYEKKMRLIVAKEKEKKKVGKEEEENADENDEDNNNNNNQKEERRQESKQHDQYQDHGAMLKKVQEKRRLEEEGDW